MYYQQSHQKVTTNNLNFSIFLVQKWRYKNEKRFGGNISTKSRSDPVLFLGTPQLPLSLYIDCEQGNHTYYALPHYVCLNGLPPKIHTPI